MSSIANDFRINFQSPITFLLLLLAPCFLYFTEIPFWWQAQIVIQLVLCLVGGVNKNWRFTAIICLVLLYFHNHSWFLNNQEYQIDCFYTANTVIGTIQHNSYRQTSSIHLIRVKISCQSNWVNVPAITIDLGNKKIKNAYYRDGDRVELSHFALEKNKPWGVTLIPTPKTRLFNHTRKNKVLNRSALFLYIQNKARYYLSAFPASIFQALLTADSSRLDKMWKVKIKELGISHLFAISGMHIGIIYFWISFLLRFLFAFPTKAVQRGRLLLGCELISIGVIFCFVDLIGMPISARRAFIMLVWWVVARYFIPWQPPWFILLGTAAIILIEQPMAINQWSFQLSFIAVAGILMILPFLPVRDHLDSKWKAIGKLIQTSIMISGWLSLLMFPLVNQIFPYIYPLSIVGNVIHIFYMGWVFLPIGLLTMGITAIGFPVSGFPGEYYFFSVVNFFGKLWEVLMVLNSEWNRLLYWSFRGQWSAVYILGYWTCLLILFWIVTRFKRIRMINE